MCEFLGLVCASDTRTDLEYNEAEPCEGRDSKSDDQKRDTSGEAALAMAMTLRMNATRKSGP
jgi:hypothetical protein